jgi:hypothetical protein
MYFCTEEIIFLFLKLNAINHVLPFRTLYTADVQHLG